LYEYETEEFTDAYWVKFQQIIGAQIAKRKLDDYPFYGQLLDISYAPQFESVAETREKIFERKNTILEKLKEDDYLGN
jgi:hypothetical protein